MEERNETLNLFKEIRALFKYWKYFLLSFCICIGLSVLYIVITKPVYQINAGVLIKNEDNKNSSPMASMLQGFSFGSSLSLGSSSVDDELLLLNSYTMIKKSIKHLKLNVNYFSNGFLSKKEYFNNSPIVIYSKNNIEESFNKTLKFKLEEEGKGLYVKVKKGFSTLAKTSGSLPLEVDLGDLGIFVIDTTTFYIPGNIASMEVLYKGYSVTTEAYMENLDISIPEKKLMIEVHNDPSKAKCDGTQSLTPADFDGLAKKLTSLKKAMDLSSQD